MRSRHTVLGAIVILFVTARALANGRYPAASLIVFDTDDPEHFVVSATFGLLETRDGGKHFRWICETALGVAGEQDLMVAITASGATVTAKTDGIITSVNGCSFHAPPALVGKNIGDLSLRRSTPHGVVAFHLDERIDGGFTSQIVRSDDDGQTWTDLGPPLPIDLLPLTIDVAPTDASRIYVSGRLDKTRDYASTLLRSTDGGQTFTRFDVPESAQHHLAYIAAVHPFDPDRVYVRVYDPQGTRVFMTEDGGATFRKIFTGTDQIYGFAVSPNGAHLALGGPGDGIWIGAADGTNLTRRSDILPNCLGFGENGLYVCADQQKAPFSLGRSTDLGATFETLLRFDALCGETGCGADTASGRRCPGDWQTVGIAAGATCGLDAGARGPTDASSEAGAVGDAGAGAPATDVTVDDSCECGLARSRSGRAPLCVAVLGVFGLGLRRLLRACPRPRVLRAG
jgi:photosystem II stability/assembly factor-like uncharacterized protein